MKFRAQGDLYIITPPAVFDGVSNRDLPPEEQFTVEVAGVTLAEQESLEKEAALDASRYEPTRRIDEQNKRVRDLVRSKVKRISGYCLGDEEVTDFDRWCEVADPPLVRWLFAVVTSAESLSRAEAKNFPPAAVSASA